MTAEVAIINRFGIAIAADSAVTIANTRVWKSTNKIFSLGPAHDVAIMIYGGGSYNGFPWEIVIKSFKAFVSEKSYSHLAHLLDEFRDYLALPPWRSEVEQEVALAYLCVKEITEIHNTIEDGLSARDYRTAFLEWVDTCSQRIENNSPIRNPISKKEFVDKLGPTVDAIFSDITSRPLRGKLKTELYTYLHSYITKSACDSGFETGVVFAGFGSDEYLPVLMEVMVDGSFGTMVRCWDARSYDFTERRGSTAMVVPFAQRDMTNVFMEGISLSYVNFFMNIVRGVLDEKTEELLDYVHDPAERLVAQRLQGRMNESTFSEVQQAFQQWRGLKFINPLIDAVESLPREEMGAMAEALVELTSLRRKFDSNLQSVAGPVDVAFISKSDGVIWLKRKLYFDAATNEEFFRRKYPHGRTNTTARS